MTPRKDNEERRDNTWIKDWTKELSEIAKENRNSLFELKTNVAVLTKDSDYIKERIRRHKEAQYIINTDTAKILERHDDILHGKNGTAGIPETLRKVETYMNDNKKVEEYASNKWRDVLYAVAQVIIIACLFAIFRQIGISSLQG